MGWKQKVLFGVLVGLVWVLTQMPDRNLHVVFCDVGQGDAVLIIKGSFQMVVDGGPSRERLLACLGRNLPFWDRKIEVVVNTHPQKDHLEGLLELKMRYKLGFNNLPSGEVSLVKGDMIRVGSLQFDVLWPEDNVKGPTLDINEVSVVGVLRYGRFKVMLTGDVGEEQEKKIKPEDVDVLKVAHHGSRYSSSSEFIEKVDPEVAVIQVGKNTFGHPTKETLSKLEQVGARIFRTDLDGEVEIVSDGKKYWIDKRW